MNPRILLAFGVLAAAVLVFAGLAYGDSPRGNQAVAEDVQDFVFLADSRPLLIRAHVRVDGQSYRSVWDAYVNRVFKFLDLDGDGVLSDKEIERMPPIQFLTGNGLYGRRMFGAGGKIERPTPNKDGRVTRDELAVFLRKNGAAPFQFQLGPASNAVYGARVITLGDQQPVSSEALNDAIFQLMDTNKDGKLSREELAAAPAVFATRDLNDDEMITPQELLPNARVLDSRAAAEKAVALANAGTSPPAANGPVVLIQPGESGTALARQLLAKYARNGRKKLTVEELGMDQATFDRLDADKDGELDSEELAQFAKRPPDVEVNIRIGGEDNGESGVDGTARPGGAVEAKVAKDQQALRLELGVTQVEFHAGTPATARGVKLNFRLRDQYINFFKMADTDSNGYLDENEAKKSPIFRDVFKAMDTDGDGMLYEKEMVAYLDKVEELQKAVLTGCVTLSLADTGNGLFDLLDRDHDGRLSVRELRGAVDLLKELDRDGDGFLARSEIPHKYELRFRRGPASGANDFNNVFVVAKSYSGPKAGDPRKKGAAGPLWFRKMDTNHDGDLSRREFLGTDEDFKRIDADGDGLISVQEAEAYDKQMRKGAPPKKK
jgi:Ca2+-binding EF-hand superfamily protein